MFEYASLETANSFSVIEEIGEKFRAIFNRMLTNDEHFDECRIEFVAPRCPILLQSITLE